MDKILYALYIYTHIFNYTKWIAKLYEKNMNLLV